MAEEMFVVRGFFAQLFQVFEEFFVVVKWNISTPD